MLQVKLGILSLRQLFRRFQVFRLNGSFGNPSFQDIDLRLIDGLLLIFLIQQMLDLTVSMFPCRSFCTSRSIIFDTCPRLRLSRINDGIRSLTLFSRIR